jgi:hypothetical protein
VELHGTICWKEHPSQLGGSTSVTTDADINNCDATNATNSTGATNTTNTANTTSCITWRILKTN